MATDKCSKCKSYLTEPEMLYCGGMCAQCEFYEADLFDDDSDILENE
jgi:hypothetical protein